MEGRGTAAPTRGDALRGASPGRRSRRTGWRIALVAIGALVVALIGARIALSPLVEARLRRSLRQMHGMTGTFGHLELSVVRLTVTVTDLRIVKLSPEGVRVPYLQVRRAQAGLYWKELLHGHLVAAARLDEPKLSMVSSAEPKNTQDVTEAPKVAERLRHMAPLRLDRLEVRNGEILWIDAHVPDRPELWLHHVNATLENLATRPALSRGEPSVLAASGTLQRSGQVSLFASADPAAKALTFAGEATVRGLQLVELGDLLSATEGVTPTRGTLDISARFQCDDGHLTGAVRPVMKHPAVQQAKPGLGSKLKAVLADVTLDVFSDRVPSRDAVATTIPIRGDVTNPNTPVWPTVLGVVRNAFVAGLIDGLRSVPAGSQRSSNDHEGAARRGAAEHGRH